MQRFEGAFLPRSVSTESAGAYSLPPSSFTVRSYILRSPRFRARESKCRPGKDQSYELQFGAESTLELICCQYNSSEYRIIRAFITLGRYLIARAEILMKVKNITSKKVVLRQLSERLSVMLTGPDPAYVWMGPASECISFHPKRWT